MYLVWMIYKCLGYGGLETVVVTREGVNMMMFGDWFEILVRTFYDGVVQWE